MSPDPRPTLFSSPFAPGHRGHSPKLTPIRYAGIGLLSITILKLFFHDLSRLGQLYRIGALVVVAVVAIFASFLYQRFLSAGEKIDEKPTTPPAA